jgi:hypothetical protein
LSAPRRFVQYRTVPALTSSALLAKRQREIPAKRERLVVVQKSSKPHNLVSFFSMKSLYQEPLAFGLLKCSAGWPPKSVLIAARKKGAWPPRPCGGWCSFSRRTLGNHGAIRRPQAGRLCPFQKVQIKADSSMTPQGCPDFLKASIRGTDPFFHRRIKLKSNCEKSQICGYEGLTPFTRKHTADGPKGAASGPPPRRAIRLGEAQARQRSTLQWGPNEDASSARGAAAPIETKW